jgi:hypothetical protein
LLQVDEPDHLVEDGRSQLFALPTEHALRSRCQLKRFGGSTQTAQAIYGAGISPGCLAELAQATVDRAGFGIVAQRRIVLTEDAVRFSADLPRGCLAFIVAAPVGCSDRSIGRIEGSAGIADEVRACLREQPIQAGLRTARGQCARRIGQS